MKFDDVNINNKLDLPEITTPGDSPSSGRNYLYFKSDDKLYKKTSGGSESEIGGVSAHNDLSGLQGGTSNEYYHLTSDEYSGLTTVAHYRENFVATASQTVFDLSGTYVTDGKTLKVYCDGALMTLTDDYTETDGNTVTFVSGRTEGTKVSFVWEKVNFLIDTTIEKNTIQDFITIGSVGDTSQQMAGHSPVIDESGTGVDIALYKFANGALTTDEKGSYTLTDHGTVISGKGIFNTDFGATFNGSDQYFTQSTLLDTMPDALAIDFWFKADDGQPSSFQTLVNKNNAANNIFYVGIETTGRISFYTQGNSATVKSITSDTILTNGSTGLFYIAINWDTTNGIRLWINDILEAQDSTATTLMTNGTTTDFFIAAYSTPANYFDGTIAEYLRIRNKVLTQKDIDFSYSTKYTKPVTFTNNDYILTAFTKKEGSDLFLSQTNWGNIEIARDSNYIYRQGGVFKATDKVRIVGRNII